MNASCSRLRSIDVCNASSMKLERVSPSRNTDSACRLSSADTRSGGMVLDFTSAVYRNCDTLQLLGFGEITSGRCRRASVQAASRLASMRPRSAATRGYCVGFDNVFGRPATAGDFDTHGEVTRPLGRSRPAREVRLDEPPPSGPSSVDVIRRARTGSSLSTCDADARSRGRAQRSAEVRPLLAVV